MQERFTKRPPLSRFPVAASLPNVPVPGR